MEVSTLEKTSYAYQKPKYTKPCPLHFQLKQKVVIIKNVFFFLIFSQMFVLNGEQTKQNKAGLKEKEVFFIFPKDP